MGLVSRLKKMKLKKLQPGRLIKGAVTVASALGVPGAGAAEKVVAKVGKKVESVERAASRIKAQIKQAGEEAGLSGGVTVNGIAGPITFGGSEAQSTGESVSTPGGGNNAMMLGLVAVVAVLFLMRGK